MAYGEEIEMNQVIQDVNSQRQNKNVNEWKQISKSQRRKTQMVGEQNLQTIRKFHEKKRATALSKKNLKQKLQPIGKFLNIQNLI